jgi:predicted O-methyltransferase YrrM
MNSLRSDARLRRVIDRLQGQSAAQEAATRDYLSGAGAGTTTGPEDVRERGRDFWRDKLVALEPDKAELCYALCRAIGARRVVEAGTSYGVSTLYLAAAVRDNGGGVVFATELEAEKASIARAHFGEAGVDDLVELREGDIRLTLADLDAPIDFLLLDIWTPLALPTMARVGPLMRAGAIVVADNTTARRNEYADLLDHLAAAENGFTTMTLPFAGGLELAVKTDVAATPG